MLDLGQLLKKARFEKGINLEQLQETTKIRKTYLEAIEDGNFNILPGNFYVRAFIKSYSEAVGLDPDEVLRLYHNVIPAALTEPHIEPVRKNRRNSFNTDRLSKWASTLLMWCFPLLIIAIIYFYFTQVYEGKPIIPDGSEITDQFEQNENPLVSEKDLPEQNREQEEEQEAPQEPQISYVNTDGTTYIYNASNTEKIKLDLKVIGDRCWVLLNKDNAAGQEIVGKNYTEDETWEFDHSIQIRLGNPSEVEIRINDILIDREKLLETNPWNIQVNLVKSN